MIDISQFSRRKLIEFKINGLSSASLLIGDGNYKSAEDLYDVVNTSVLREVLLLGYTIIYYVEVQHVNDTTEYNLFLNHSIINIGIPPSYLKRLQGITFDKVITLSKEEMASIDGRLKFRIKDIGDLSRICAENGKMILDELKRDVEAMNIVLPEAEVNYVEVL
jgi:hypothetical protein